MKQQTLMLLQAEDNSVIWYLSLDHSIILSMVWEVEGILLSDLTKIFGETWSNHRCSQPVILVGSDSIAGGDLLLGWMHRILTLMVILMSLAGKLIFEG